MNRHVLLAVGLAVVLAGASLPALASTHYTVDASPAVDTPTRTVDFGGKTYTISSIGRADPGESVTATVSAPAGDAYRVLLYNADGQVVDFERGTGDDTVSFDTESGGSPYDPGTYLLVVNHDGVDEAAQPLVLSAYRVAATAPGSATEGETIDVSASLSTVAGNEPVEAVTVVIGDDEDDRRVALSETGDGQYEASITLTQLGPGNYDLYVVVQGPEQVFGRLELLGVSDSQSFTITEPADPADDGSSGSTGDGGASSTTEPGSTTDAPDSSSTDSPDGSTTETDDPTTATTTTERSAPTTDRPATPDGNVITPAQPTTDAPGTPTETAVWLDWADVPLLVVAFVLLLWWVRR